MEVERPQASRVMLLVGLPGAGKTRLAQGLAPRIGATVLNRDDIRDAIFPNRYLDYSKTQNAVATRTLLAVLDYLLCHPEPKSVIVDGKPFSRAAEIAEMRALVEGHSAHLTIIHCITDQNVIESRLSRDLSSDPRNACAQRNAAKAQRIRRSFDPIQGTHITIDTGAAPEVVVASCLDALRAAGAVT